MPLAAGLFRAHVSGRPGVALSLADFPIPQGQAEIRDERFAAGVEQDVARLDVAGGQDLGDERSATYRPP